MTQEQTDEISNIMRLVDKIAAIQRLPERVFGCFTDTRRIDFAAKRIAEHMVEHELKPRLEALYVAIFGGHMVGGE